MLCLHCSFSVPLCPWETKLHVLWSSHITWGPSHGMLSFLNWFYVSFPQAAGLQELLQHGSIPWGPSVRANCSKMGPPQESAPARPPDPAWDSLHGLQCGKSAGGQPAPTWALTQGNFCSGTWSTSSPPSLLLSVSVGLFLAPFWCCCFVLFICFFLNYTLLEVQPQLVIGLPLSSSESLLEPAGTASSLT